MEMNTRRRMKLRTNKNLLHGKYKRKVLRFDITEGSSTRFCDSLVVETIYEVMPNKGAFKNKCWVGEKKV